MTRLAKGFGTIFVALFLVFSAASSQAASAANGVWQLGTGDYLVLMQDEGSGATIALQLDLAQQSGKAWVGAGSGTTLSLSTLNSSGTLSAQVSGSSLSGTIAQEGSTSAITGTLVLAYAGGPYDGIWQKTDASNAYLAYMTITSGGVPISLVVDFAVNAADYTASYDVVVGAETMEMFVGTSLINSSKLTMSFNLAVTPATASGSYATTGRPPQVLSTFGCSQIFKLS